MAGLDLHADPGQRAFLLARASISFCTRAFSAGSSLMAASAGASCAWETGTIVVHAAITARRYCQPCQPRPSHRVSSCIGTASRHFSLSGSDPPLLAGRSDLGSGTAAAWRTCARADGGLAGSPIRCRGDPCGPLAPMVARPRSRRECRGRGRPQGGGPTHCFRRPRRPPRPAAPALPSTAGGARSGSRSPSRRPASRSASARWRSRARTRSRSTG